MSFKSETIETFKGCRDAYIMFMGIFLTAGAILGSLVGIGYILFKIIG